MSKSENLEQELLEKGYSQESINLAKRTSEAIFAVVFLVFSSLFFLYLPDVPFHIALPIALYGMIRSSIMFIV